MNEDLIAVEVIVVLLPWIILMKKKTLCFISALFQNLFSDVYNSIPYTITISNHSQKSSSYYILLTISSSITITKFKKKGNLLQENIIHPALKNTLLKNKSYFKNMLLVVLNQGCIFCHVTWISDRCMAKYSPLVKLIVGLPAAKHVLAAWLSRALKILSPLKYNELTQQCITCYPLYHNKTL